MRKVFILNKLYAGFFTKQVKHVQMIFKGDSFNYPLLIKVRRLETDTAMINACRFLSVFVKKLLCAEPL